MIKLIGSIFIGLSSSIFPIVINKGIKSPAFSTSKIISKSEWSSIDSWKRFENCRRYSLKCDSFIPKDLPEDVKQTMSRSYLPKTVTTSTTTQ